LIPRNEYKVREFKLKEFYYLMDIALLLSPNVALRNFGLLKKQKKFFKNGKSTVHQTRQ
jgi:hypothetical protein